MPFYLKESDSLSRLAGAQSVLIVPCRFCPAASMAVREKKPYIELFRRFFRTEAYESYITTLKGRLEDQGIKPVVFDSKLLHQFVACMWTTKRRNELAAHAANYDALVVLGCDAMVDAVSEAVNSADCRVVQGMEIEGLMNVLPSLSFPLNITLELNGVTSIQEKPHSQRAGAH